MSAQMKRLNIADEKFSGKKAFGFSLVRLGNILAGLMIGEVTYFATNSLALTAAAISTGVAIKTAIDAVTDLIMGTIVDRTHTKYGKAIRAGGNPDVDYPNRMFRGSNKLVCRNGTGAEKPLDGCVHNSV